MARKSWEEGWGWRRVVGVGEKGEAKVEEEGWRLHLSCAAPATFVLRFFFAHVLGMGWVV